MSGSDEDLNTDRENSGAKQNRSSKTSAVPAADEKHPRSKRMHAHPTTGDSGIAFSERPYRAAFLTATDYRRLRNDPRRDLDAFWKRGEFA